MRAGGLTERIRTVLSDLDTRDLPGLAERGRQVRDLILNTPLPDVLQRGSSRHMRRSALLNAGLFLPFGFGLASLLTWRTRLTGLMSVAVVFGVCFALSYAIEVLQQLMPSRYPALRDVLANSFRGVLGCGWQSLVRWRCRRHHEGACA